MRHLFLGFSLFLGLFIAFTPPGVCPCWLMEDPAHTHPHPDGHPEKAHNHGYLFNLFQTQTSAAGPIMTLLPVSLLLALLVASGLWRQLIHVPTFAAGWTAAPLSPPPKLRTL
jgi:hypothetical protein